MMNIGPYRVVRSLGQGLRTDVWEIVTPRGPAALKILKDPGDRDGDFSLREEFRILASISHPHIITVRDFGRTDDGKSFFTMELVDGRHFSRAFRGPSRPFFTGLAQILAAFNHIHYLGLVHGDVKPGNVLVSRIARKVTVKLTDFGMVQNLGVTAQIRHGGTPGYMAPEIFAGGRPDGRADLYSLGIVLLETLGARPSPAQVPPSGMLKDSLTPEPPTVRDWRVSIPTQLERVLERMTARLPENRPRGAIEVIESLGEFLPASETKGLKTGKRPLLSSSLVGRKKELKHLLARTREVSRGQNLAALITGPIGIGKSRFLREFKSRAQLKGLSILAFACARSDRRPLGPFAEILKDELAVASRATEPSPEETSPDSGQLVLQYELAARHFERIGRQSGSPIVILVDDLAFGAPAVQSLLEYLTKYCEADNGLMCVATAETDVWEKRDQVDFPVDHVELRGLSATQTKKLISNILGIGASPELARWIHRYSGGLPLLVEETLAWLHRSSPGLSTGKLDVEPDTTERKSPPKTIGALTSLLVRGLEENELDVLRKAAVIGDHFERSILTNISGFEEEKVRTTLASLGARNLIQRETDLKYSFTHAWLAGSLYSRIDPEKRRTLHGKIVRALESFLPSAHYELARHAAQADLTAKTARYALAAAREARKAGSLDSSIEFFRLALSSLRKTSTKRTKIAEELADCQIWKGDHRSAISSYMSISEKTKPPRDKARLLRKAALSYHLLADFKASNDLLCQARAMIKRSSSTECVRILLLSGWNEISLHHYEKAKVPLQAALERATRLREKILISRIQRALGTVELRLGRPVAARELAIEALSAAREGDAQHVASSAELLLAAAEHEAGRFKEARAILERVLALTREISYLGGQGSALVKLALVEQELGKSRESRDHYEDALRVFLKIQEEEQAALTENNLGCLLDTIGDWEGARKRYSSALRRFRKMGAAKWASACLVNMGRIQILMGEGAEGVSSIKEGIRIGGSSGFWPSIVEAYETLSMNLMNEGDLEAALAQARLGREVALKKGVSPAEPILQAADIYLAKGDLTSATREYEALCGMEPDDLSLAGRILRLKARLFPDTAQASITESISIFMRLNSRFELARTLMTKAELYAKGTLSPPAGDGMQAALSTTQDALDIYRSLGAKPYLDAAAEKLADYKRRARGATEGENIYLRTIFAVNKMLDLLADHDSMLDRILDLLIDMLGAERGMLLLMGEDGDLFPAAGRKMDKKSEKDVTQISRTVVRNVAVTGKPTLSGNAVSDPRYTSMHSISLHRIKSLLCVPLVDRGEPMGALYVDSTVARDLFTPYDDEFLLTIGNLLASSIDKSRYISMLETRNAEMKKLLRDTYSSRNIVGSSARMSEIARLIYRYAKTDRNVLITGERGTGKGLVAKALHFESPRRNGPFVVVDAAHIPAALIEDALFGHARGAFSGAYTASPGLIESARTGTIFLDNVGSIHLDVQAKLVRPFQSKEVRRLGSTRSQRLDFRIVSATSIPAQSLLEKNALRPELHLILKVLEIDLPPLRERGTDVLELATHFLERFASDSGKRIRGLSKEAVEMLLSHSWPGNVTELERCIERAVTLSRGELIRAGDMGLQVADSIPTSSALSFSRDLAEFSELSSALTRTRGNVTLAARVLSVSRRQLQRLLKKHGLTSEEFRNPGKRSTPLSETGSESPQSK